MSFYPPGQATYPNAINPASHNPLYEAGTLTPTTTSAYNNNNNPSAPITPNLSVISQHHDNHNHHQQNMMVGQQQQPPSSQQYQHQENNPVPNNIAAPPQPYQQYIRKEGVQEYNLRHDGYNHQPQQPQHPDSILYRQQYNAGYNQYEGEYGRNARYQRLEGGEGMRLSSHPSSLYTQEESAVLNTPISLCVINSSNSRECWNVPCRLADSGYVFRSALVKIAGRFVPFLYVDGRKIDLNLTLWESGIKESSTLGTGVGASVKARYLVSTGGTTAARKGSPSRGGDHRTNTSSSRVNMYSTNNNSRLRPPNGVSYVADATSAEYAAADRRRRASQRAVSADAYVNPQVADHMKISNGRYRPTNLHSNLYRPTTARPLYNNNNNLHHAQQQHRQHFDSRRAASAPRDGRYPSPPGDRFNGQYQQQPQSPYSRHSYDNTNRFENGDGNYSQQLHNHSSAVYSHRERQADLARERQEILHSSLSSPSSSHQRWNNSTNTNYMLADSNANSLRHTATAAAASTLPYPQRRRLDELNNYNHQPPDRSGLNSSAPPRQMSPYRHNNDSHNYGPLRGDEEQYYHYSQHPPPPHHPVNIYDEDDGSRSSMYRRDVMGGSLPYQQQQQQYILADQYGGERCYPVYPMPYPNVQPVQYSTTTAAYHPNGAPPSSPYRHNSNNNGPQYQQRGVHFA